MDTYVVLDIGKTNVKLTALDGAACILAELQRPNASCDRPPYLQHDVDGIWDWLLDCLRGWATRFHIRAIVPVTHGATAALVDEQGLVLPVLDYEADLAGPVSQAYARFRPSFAETCSPALPGGLNLGRQLYWQQQNLGAAFSRAEQLLLYPQYWAWRLAGVAAGEVTSLGCHTDLWQPLARSYSGMVREMRWEHLLPPLQPAGATLGCLRVEVVRLTGLPADCRVVCGIHDSNASLLRHLGSGRKTVLSTGTWVIAAALGQALDGLDERLDMLANVSAEGEPVPCMRFMGGREFAVLAGSAPQPCSPGQLERLIRQGSMALPCFAAAGPFAGRVAQLPGPPVSDAQQRYALATVYCALMTDYCLTRLDAEASVVIEGSFTANPYFAGLLAALRPGRAVAVSDDACGTTAGGWMLATGRAWPPAQAERWAAPLAVPGLAAYAQRWRQACGV